MAKDEAWLADVKERYRESCDAWNHIYTAARDDLRFIYDVSGGQWPESMRLEREAAGRPVLTVNKLQKTLRRIRGDHMMNRSRMTVLPVDDKADPQMAELYNGLIREIEYLSSAEIAYDTAYNHALSASVGFYRLITAYTDDSNFEQDIRIERIINPFQIHFDPFAVKFMYEDAQYCFVEDLISTKRFKELYPKATETDFDSSSELFGDWLQEDKVKIAEYFYKESVKKKIVQLKTGEIIPIDSKMTIDAIKHLGSEITREREVDVTVVKWCKLSGGEVLEEADWVTDDIPIIPMFGDEVVVDGKRHYISLARGAKGPQIMYNYWCTSATEAGGMIPKMPFIVEKRQIKGFEKEWEESNRTNRMYVRYNAVAGLQKPTREPQGQVPVALISLMQSTAYDIEDHLGQYESSKGEASNERSAVAIKARVGQSDKGTYLFVDNSTRSIICGGRQIIKLIPKIYDTQRALRIRGDDGTETVVTVNQETPNGRINDLSVGKYDLIASVGASFSSKRQEMVQNMLSAMQYAPNVAAYIAPLIFKYSDAPGAAEIANAITEGMKQQQALELAKEQGGHPQV